MQPTIDWLLRVLTLPFFHCLLVLYRELIPDTMLEVQPSLLLVKMCFPVFGRPHSKSLSKCFGK